MRQLPRGAGQLMPFRCGRRGPVAPACGADGALRASASRCGILRAEPALLRTHPVPGNGRMSAHRQPLAAATGVVPRAPAGPSWTPAACARRPGPVGAEAVTSPPHRLRHTAATGLDRTTPYRPHSGRGHGCPAAQRLRTPRRRGSAGAMRPQVPRRPGGRVLPCGYGARHRRRAARTPPPAEHRPAGSPRRVTHHGSTVRNTLRCAFRARPEPARPGAYPFPPVPAG